MPHSPTFPPHSETPPDSDESAESSVVVSRSTVDRAAPGSSAIRSEPASSRSYRLSPSVRRLSVHVYSTTPGCLIATIGDALVSFVRYTMNEQSLDALDRACENLCKRYGRFGYLSVLEVGVPLPRSAAVQSRLQQLVARHTDDIYAASIVYSGQGFEATVVRSCVTSVNLASRAKHPNRVFTNLEEGIGWMRSLSALPKASRSGAISLKGAKCDPEELKLLASAVDQLRTNWLG